jgi:hypothetical protein
MTVERRAGTELKARFRASQNLIAFTEYRKLWRDLASELGTDEKAIHRFVKGKAA